MKEVVNYDAAKKLVKYIEDAERKLGILKKYVDTKKGTVNTSVAARIVLSTEKSVNSVRDQVIKFL